MLEKDSHGKIFAASDEGGDQARCSISGMVAQADSSYRALFRLDKICPEHNHQPLSAIACHLTDGGKRLRWGEESRGVKAGDRFLWIGPEDGCAKDPWVAQEAGDGIKQGHGIKQERTGKLLHAYPHNLLLTETNWERLPAKDAAAPASTPSPARADYSRTVRISLGEIDVALDAFKPAAAPAPALLPHAFTDPYLTFVVRRADGTKTVHLLCKGCGAMNVGAVMATACPGPRDWSADRKRGESAHAFNTDQIDARAKKEREEWAELEKKQPRAPGPGLLHAGSLVGGPQFGAWRREGC